METLGEKLALPPFLEPRRAEIEAGLKPIGWGCGYCGLREGSHALGIRKSAEPRQFSTRATFC